MNENIQQSLKLSICHLPRKILKKKKKRALEELLLTKESKKLGIQISMTSSLYIFKQVVV